MRFSLQNLAGELHHFDCEEGELVTVDDSFFIDSAGARDRICRFIGAPSRKLVAILDDDSKVIEDGQLLRLDDLSQGGYRYVIKNIVFPRNISWTDLNDRGREDCSIYWFQNYRDRGNEMSDEMSDDASDKVSDEVVSD